MPNGFAERRLMGNSKHSPDVKDENFPKFLARKDKALAAIVLSLLTVQPSLRYLIGDPEDPSEIWQKLESQFQKRTNLFEAKRGRFCTEHIKAMTEIFDGLSVIGDPISDEDRVVHLLASHADVLRGSSRVDVLSANSTGPLNKWIVDSGATCHMSCDDKLFDELHSLKQPLEVMLGDGYAVEATGRGTVVLELTEVGGKARRCKLHEVLYVSDLSYNLLSVSKAAKAAGKVVKFTETGCDILDSNKTVITVATRVGSLYHLNCQADNEQINAAVNKSKETKEDTWHRRYGHLGVRNQQKLAEEKLVDDFDFNSSREPSLCESCVEGKHHRSRFPVDGGKRSSEPLGLVHSDVCGKMNAKSLSRGEYFLTFIDNTCYTWI